jgi:hypothetical protein
MEVDGGERACVEGEEGSEGSAATGVPPSAYFSYAHAGDRGVLQLLAAAASAHPAQGGARCSSASASGTAGAAARGAPKKPVPPELLLHLVQLVHGSAQGKPALVSAFVNAARGRGLEVAKSQVEARIDEVAAKGRWFGWEGKAPAPAGPSKASAKAAAAAAAATALLAGVGSGEALLPASAAAAAAADGKATDAAGPSAGRSTGSHVELLPFVRAVLWAEVGLGRLAAAPDAAPAPLPCMPPKVFAGQRYVVHEAVLAELAAAAGGWALPGDLEEGAQAIAAHVTAGQLKEIASPGASVGVKRKAPAVAAVAAPSSSSSGAKPSSWAKPASAAAAEAAASPSSVFGGSGAAGQASPAATGPTSSLSAAATAAGDSAASSAGSGVVVLE